MYMFIQKYMQGEDRICFIIQVVHLYEMLFIQTYYDCRDERINIVVYITSHNYTLQTIGEQL